MMMIRIIEFTSVTNLINNWYSNVSMTITSCVRGVELYLDIRNRKQDREDIRSPSAVMFFMTE